MRLPWNGWTAWMAAGGLLLLAASGATEAGSAPAHPPSNGVPWPEGWQEWATVAVSHRTDNGTLRVILGNDAAMAAIREGRTNPWPDGAALAKVVWKAAPSADWPAAEVPEKLVHAEFMVKDSSRWAETGGWGWARWVGEEAAPYDEGPAACVACHEPVRDRDLVFTRPAPFPR